MLLRRYELGCSRGDRRHWFCIGSLDCYVRWNLNACGGSSLDAKMLDPRKFGAEMGSWLGTNSGFTNDGNDPVSVELASMVPYVDIGLCHLCGMQMAYMATNFCS